MFKKFLCSSIVILTVLCFCAVLANGENLKTGIVTGNTVNVRQTPVIADDNVITQLVKGTKVSVISVKGTWTKIQYNNISGWISNDYIKVTEQVQIGTVTTSVLNVRSSADQSSDLITKIEKGDRVTVLLKSGNWYKVKLSDGTIGWVSADYLTVGSSTSRGDDVRSEDNTAANTQDSQETSDLRQRMVEYSKQFLGCNYNYGGSSPSGFDCSGFTSFIYRHFGIELEHSSSGQSTQGTGILKANLKPGDLVFFDTGRGSIGHVGMYIGDGKFIHAATESKGVIISSLYESYYTRTYVKARRIID